MSTNYYLVITRKLTDFLAFKPTTNNLDSNFFHILITKYLINFQPPPWSCPHPPSFELTPLRKTSLQKNFKLPHSSLSPKEPTPSNPISSYVYIFCSSSRFRPYSTTPINSIKTPKHLFPFLFRIPNHNKILFFMYLFS